MKFKTSRRKFFIAGAIGTAGLAILKRLWPANKPSPVTAKFLTREGTLVEVPVSQLPKKKTPITKERLVSWVWKQQKL